MPVTTKIATFRLSEDDNFVCRKALEPILQIKSRSGTGILFFPNQRLFQIIKMCPKTFEMCPKT